MTIILPNFSSSKSIGLDDSGTGISSSVDCLFCILLLFCCSIGCLDTVFLLTGNCLSAATTTAAAAGSDKDFFFVFRLVRGLALAIILLLM